jgi:hypothetical protein
MAEELESPTEQAQEDLHHHAQHASEKWVGWVALTAAVLAALAAVNALLAGHYANEAMIERMAENDQWSYYQAKGVKAAVLGSKLEMLAALDKPARDKDDQKLQEYAKQQDEISKEAKAEGERSKHHMEQHHTLAQGVTMFQVAIAVAAISVLSKRRRFWLVSLGFGAVGVVFLVVGLVR